MAKEAPGPKNNTPPPSPKAPGSDKCKFEECKKSQDKFGFCMEHYEWYMEGVIRGDGRKPLDFHQKHTQWVSKKHKQKVA